MSKIKKIKMIQSVGEASTMVMVYLRGIFNDILCEGDKLRALLQYTGVEFDIEEMQSHEVASMEISKCDGLQNVCEVTLSFYDEPEVSERYKIVFWVSPYREMMTYSQRPSP